ncbi:hypothetical protein FR483_n440R [Paramecium bursaria Chlorella virus FR483]|uniref:Uncharacterized protein n440R n=1 Tax=Paramecium bursaria Chlorella virus FR483 TaxID=399781 RepID=A7J7E4_PBCVF|nr:hypothetical protein FR483_n440R [Paramecium bursaria Chlorella virus FR483]ABT15725.1 hypothetical protein FR483_n440R [Paramecium bursaria Chlorella virus FR483]
MLWRLSAKLLYLRPELRAETKIYRRHCLQFLFHAFQVVCKDFFTRCKSLAILGKHSSVLLNLNTLLIRTQIDEPRGACTEWHEICKIQIEQNITLRHRI